MDDGIGHLSPIALFLPTWHEQVTVRSFNYSMDLH